MARERRKSTRIRIDLEVDYRCDDTYLFAYITDVSAFGIFLRCGNPHPVGTRLGIRFKLPDGGRAMTLETEVMWVKTGVSDEETGLHPGMGLRFVSLTDAARERLLALVKQGGVTEN